MGEVGSFLHAFSEDNKFFLPLPFLWKVSITGIGPSAITNALNKAGEKWSASVSPGDFTRDGNILVAQEVTIPSENSVISPFGQQNRGGFLPGYGVVERADFTGRSVIINFLETDRDIEHYFFRPWAIAIGIDGLINQGLKGTITVKQYNNRGVMRKGFVFRQAFPTNVESYTQNYGDQEFSQRSVTFCCTNYSQL